MADMQITGFGEGKLNSRSRYECWLFDDCSELTRKRYVFCEHDNGVRLDVYAEEARKTKRSSWVSEISWYRLNRRVSWAEKTMDVPRFCIDRAVEHFRGLIQWAEE